MTTHLGADGETDVDRERGNGKVGPYVKRFVQFRNDHDKGDGSCERDWGEECLGREAKEVWN